MPNPQFERKGRKDGLTPGEDTIGQVKSAYANEACDTLDFTDIATVTLSGGWWNISASASLDATVDVTGFDVLLKVMGDDTESFGDTLLSAVTLSEQPATLTHTSRLIYIPTNASDMTVKLAAKTYGDAAIVYGKIDCFRPL
jgi:hypothetical protein